MSTQNPRDKFAVKQLIGHVDWLLNSGATTLERPETERRSFLHARLETKLVEDKLTRELACVDGYESFWVFSEKKLGYSGVATYARDNWAPNAVELDRLGTIDTDLNGEGRVIVSDHGSFVLLNVYVPNAGAKQENMTSRGDLKIRFLHALKDKCDALRSEGREVMIVGDLNIAASQKDMHPTIRFEGLYHPQEVAVLQSILKTYTDVWRLQHPNESESYTCWDEKSFARSVNKGVRIDYVLVSPGLLARMGKCEIISTPSKWSDHAALLVTVKDVIPPEPHNPVPQSSKRMKRFDTRSQPTIASMFARRSGKVMTAGAKITDPGTASALQPNADNAVDQTVKTGVKAAVKEAVLGVPIVDSAPSSLEEENQNARKRQRTTSDPGLTMHQLADHGLVNRSSPNQPRWNPILRPYKRQKAEVTSRAVNAPLEKYKPDWAGDDALSKFVNAAISFKPLYKLMKIMAKKVITQTAEKEGLPWRKHVKDLSGIQEIYDIKEELEDDSIEYPSYYLQAFHAYDKGNLDWTAAFEAEMATLVIGSRTFKDSNMTVYEAQDKLRDAIAKNLQDYLKENQTPSPDQILDVGCSVGVSSRYLAKQFPEATILGLDLSPYFIAVAEYQEREMERSSEESRSRIQYKHGLGESTGLPSESFDLVQIGFVIHECRPFAIENLIKEAFRLLRPGGSILLFDNNPRSKTIQNLPPALFTLMKSTEPWSDEYYMMDVEAALERTGFRNIETKESDHRHRTIIGLKL